MVEITFAVTVALEDADTISKLIRKGGTEAVLAIGAWKEAQEAALVSQSPAPSLSL